MSNSVDLDYHAGQPVLTRGINPLDADRVVILIHGRGDSAAGILGLASVLPHDGVAFVAPQARGNTWYPQSFLAPIDRNEPGISSGIHVIGSLVTDVLDKGIGRERIFIVGFSQGACLASEFVARNPSRYGGLVVLSGGLIGNGEDPAADPPNDKTFDYAGGLEGMPVFMGCSDVDPHIPLARFERSSEVLSGLGALVTKRVYQGMAHTVNQDEIDHVARLIND